MRALATLLLLGALAAGCSDAVDPTLGTAQAFSLYGYLDPTADRQALRVVPILGAIDGDTLRALPAVVTSVERGTGRVAAWRDSAVDFRDGSVGHVFVADYTPTPGETVDLRVEETTGERRVTTVEVPVPALDRPDLQAAITGPAGVTYPIRIRAPRILATSLVFRVVGLRSAPTDTVAVPFDAIAPFVDAGGGRWALDLDFLPTARAFLTSFEVGGAPLRLVDVTVRTFVAGPSWEVPPGGLDEDRVVEPGTFSNVTGGFGFVGAGFWTAATWTPSLTAQSRAGFVVDLDPASVLRINEVSAAGWIELYNPTLETVAVGGYRLSLGEASAPFPAGATVGPKGFRVLYLATSLSDGTATLEGLSGTPLVVADVVGLPEGDLGTIGSYPDGRTRLIGELAGYRGFDLFRGLVAPTPGAPNRLTAALSVVNEVFTAGPSGWVELANRPGVVNVSVSDDADRPVQDWAFASEEGAFWVANETPNRLELEQTGGELFVVVFLRDVPPRVHDVRPFGPQTPKQSSGRLPDGPGGFWRTGLRPTRGAANAVARFGL